MLKILPEKIKNALNYLDLEKLYELRIRQDKKVIINYSGIYVELLENPQNLKSYIIATKNDIELIMGLASKRSFYAFNEQIKQGYITIEGGIRIGICGEIVKEKGEIITIKNINSLNIRFPHEILGCSDKVISYILNDNRILNTLIISPPACGKTTILRDIARNISLKIKNVNILIIDEKNEISSTINGKNMLNVGDSTDVYVNCKKEYGINIGIKNMRPDVIITDELSSDNEIDVLKNCVSSGVSIISSMHSKTKEHFLLKENVKEKIIKEKVFDRYIILSSINGNYKVDSIFDSNLNNILGVK